MRELRHTLLLGVAVLAFVPAPLALGEKPPTEDEALRIRLLERARARLERSLHRTLAHIAEDTGGRTVVALLRVKPVQESDLASPVSGLLDGLFLRALLLRGILTRDVEAEGPIQPMYVGGKLRQRSRVTEEHRARLRNRLRLGFALEPRWRQADGRYEVDFRLLELDRGQTLRKWSLWIDASKVPLSEIASIRPLPAANQAILLYAIRMMGRRVARGECWDVPAMPLRARGFWPRGYRFGRRVPFEAAVPGDVVTIDTRGHHHVMVLWQKGATLGKSNILHQNWNGKRHVMVMRYPAQMIRGSIIQRPHSSRRR